MSHELAIGADGRTAMAYTGEVPWHGLGQSLAADAPLDDWIVQAGMDFVIDEAPVEYVVPHQGETKQDVAEHGGRLLRFKGRKVLYRRDTLAPLGDVSDGYKTVQPVEVMEFFRDLTGAAGFQVETAGVLFGGRKYWCLARVTEDMPILDLRDKIGLYLLLSTSADGSMATTGRWTAVRVVCRNTISVALRGTAAVSISHRSHFEPSEAKKVLGLVGDEARAAFGEAMGDLRKLAEKPVTQSDVLAMSFKLFGIDPGDPEARRSKEFREKLEKAAKSKPFAAVTQTALDPSALIGSGLDGGRDTAWAWVNAVTQYVDHMAPVRNGDGARDRKLDRAWFGTGEAMKNKAMGIALDAAGLGKRKGDAGGKPDLKAMLGLDELVSA